MLRIDREVKKPLNREHMARLCHLLEERWCDFDGIILSDYGKGILTESFLDMLRIYNKKWPRIVGVDPKARDFTRYRSFSFLTPNQKEAEQAMDLKLDQEDVLIKESAAFRKQLDLDILLVTLGARGMLVAESDGHERIDTEAREVFDVTGAGDTVIAMFTAGLCAGLKPGEAARFANAGAGIVVGKVGAATVNDKDLENICQ
jgi:D-beta-D-heptose 7-phosphate kinase/D-beta-D-heptose 1-phosphate adenosyltransferase